MSNPTSLGNVSRVNPPIGQMSAGQAAAATPAQARMPVVVGELLNGKRKPVIVGEFQTTPKPIAQPTKTPEKAATKTSGIFARFRGKSTSTPAPAPAPSKVEVTPERVRFRSPNVNLHAYVVVGKNATTSDLPLLAWGQANGALGDKKDLPVAKKQEIANDVMEDLTLELDGCSEISQLKKNELAAALYAALKAQVGGESTIATGRKSGERAG